MNRFYLYTGFSAHFNINMFFNIKYIKDGYIT